MFFFAIIKGKLMKVFNEKDYNSGDGMLTSVWGPSMWHTLHAISFNYPVKPTKDDKVTYLNFFKSIGGILPCRYCRENFKKNIKSVPLTMATMKNRETFSRWLYKLHEEINKMLGKKSNLSYNDVRDRYELFRARCINDNIGEKKTKKSKKHNKPKKEKGCVKPLYKGQKSKCVINIVPKKQAGGSFIIDRRCKLKKSKKSN
jgi:hypothetical protein